MAVGGKKCPFGVLSDAILIFSTCFSFTHKCSPWPVHGNQWAKTINIFMHGSQEMSATLSADQFTDRVTRADPNHSHVGCIHRSCGKMALQWLHLVIPALSEPKAISHAMLKRNKHVPIMFHHWIINTNIISVMKAAAQSRATIKHIIAQWTAGLQHAHSRRTLVHLVHWKAI